MNELATIPAALMAERNRDITQTIQQMSRRLLRFIQQRVPNTADAEDILQDVFYQFAGNTQPIQQVSNWLFTVARNKITDSYRKKKLPLAEDVFKVNNGEEDTMNWTELLVNDDGTPETAYLRNLFWEQLQEALDELPEEQSQVFVWNEMEDIPFKDISAKTGVPVPTLISRKRYAVLHLRKRLETLKNDIQQL